MADDLLASMQALEDYRISLTLCGDFDALADVLSETLVYGHSTGTRDTKASMLKLLREGTVEYVSIVSALDTASRLAAGVVLVSGMLAGGAELANRPAIVDVPTGKGHVVLYANNPMWRHETQGSFCVPPVQ
jgi:hypothetical protein